MPPPHTHLEDFSEDIIAKAQSGLQITNRELADRGSVDLGTIKALKNGDFDEKALASIAKVLNLDPDRLIVSAAKNWMPSEKIIPSLHCFISQFKSMTVNAYLYTASDGRSVLFDTGVDPDPILTFLRERDYSLEAIVLTHGHPDHVVALKPILEVWPDRPVFAHPAENVNGSRTLEWNSSIRIGPLSLRCLSTPGHTPGGTSFLIEGVDPSLCIVGDALFAGSVGGCAADYDHSLTPSGKIS